MAVCNPQVLCAQDKVEKGKKAKFERGGEGKAYGRNYIRKQVHFPPSSLPGGLVPRTESFRCSEFASLAARFTPTKR